MIERIPLTTRDAWLADRLRFINASEIAIVCGEAGYASLAELYAEKKALRPPLVDSAIMRRGRWFESAVFEALADERPEWEIRRAHIHVRDTDRRLACTPDGFAIAPDRVGTGVVQAKVVARAIFRQRWLDDPDDKISGDATPPAAYRLQTLMEMMLNESKWGVLAVLIHGEFDYALRLFDVERDPVLEDLIESRAAAFWRDHLDPNIMPPFQPQRDEKLIRALYPNDNGSEIDLTGDNRALVAVEELIEATAARKRNATTEEKLKTELRGKLGSHTFGRLADGRRLSLTTHHREAYPVKASTYRTLRILPVQT
jgi:predicted phage-related endonuclease